MLHIYENLDIFSYTSLCINTINMCIHIEIYLFTQYGVCVTSLGTRAMQDTFKYRNYKFKSDNIHVSLLTIYM